MQTLKNFYDQIEKLKSTLSARIDQYPDEHYAIATCEEACIAVSEGNYGVGSILVNPEGTIIHRDHNRMFYPYFRSDLHAEMSIMNFFENNYKDITDTNGFRIISSLESCPMCLTRLIMSRIETIQYVVQDEGGGFINDRNRLPVNFYNLQKSQNISQACSSPEIQKISLQIFLLNAVQLRSKLLQRLST